jgi:hypothetical protein
LTQLFGTEEEDYADGLVNKLWDKEAELAVINDEVAAEEAA